MMKQFIPLLLVASLVGMGMSACPSFTAEQAAKFDKLSKENEELTKKLETLVAKAKAGELSPAEAILAVEQVRAAIASNMTELEKLKEEGVGGGTTFAVLVALFGRTAMHALSGVLGGAFPALAPLLTLALGGSETKKISVATADTKTS